MSTSSRSPSPSPSRSPSPDIPLQPDHFYGNDDIQLPPSPNSDGRNWLDPADDPAAQRGIPVFKPTMDQFLDFEAYMTKVEPWGMRSGIVKIIPPQEWTDRLPSVVPQLDKVRLKSPIEQHMLGQGGLFQQQNIEKRRVMSVREWYELCSNDDLRAPGVDDIGLHARANNGSARTRTRRTRRANASANADMDARMSETAEPEAISVKHEHEDDLLPPDPVVDPASVLISPPNSNRTLSPADNAEHAAPTPQPEGDPVPGPSQPPQTRMENEGEEEGVKAVVEEDVKPKKGRRPAPSRESKEAELADRAEKDHEWLQSFDPLTAWLPPNTSSSSYTTEFCKELERRYWRNCGFGKPPWYGADMQGSLFTDETTAWNVACLPSALTRLLPSSSKGLPGVNTPYLYFGMWRATFAWHVEDMDLFSINYIHFGAPKFWYAMPQARANALEQTMKGLFPGAGKKCSQFLRHKSYLVSPTLLAKTSCRPNFLVQKAGEFVITFPRGYHAGFNLGFNCAESVNFALESWIDIGRKAQACGCVNYSVRIDVDQLLRDREAEQQQVYRNPKRHRRIKSEPGPEMSKGKENDAKPRTSRKRKSEGDSPVKAKKLKIKAFKPPSEQPASSSSDLPAQTSPSKTLKVTLKLPPPPKPKEPETFPCCLCPSMSKACLLRVQDPPAWWYSSDNAEAAKGPCMAHVDCANVIPETWVDEIEIGEPDMDGVRPKENVIFGVDGIVKDRWNLKCTACTKPKNRVHGAPIQCTKGKCPKAFHVSCARDGHANGIVYRVLREVEKEVVLLDNQAAVPIPPPPPPEPSVLQLYPMPGAAAPNASASAGEVHMEVDPPVVGPFVPPAPPHQAPAQPQHQPSPSPQVLKTIKKTEVEVLCHQHNPTVLAAKKAQQQDRIRNALLALPPLSRIKLRVTAGVFEVTLVRIIEETCSVEVLWDRGLRREFKWRSVVFGETDAVVGQKPAEAAPEPERIPVPVQTSYPAPSHLPSSATASSATPSTSHTPSYAPSSTPSTPAPPYPIPSGHYPYPPQYHTAGSSSYQYSAGNWSYYPSRPSHHAPSHPSYPPAAAPAGPSYPQSPVYSQPQYGHGPTGYYSYANGASHPSYSSYSQYSGYGGYAPPPLPAPVSQAQPLSRPADSQAKALQWQQPYKGPPTASKPSSTVPAVPTYTAYPQASAVVANASRESHVQPAAPPPPSGTPDAITGEEAATSGPQVQREVSTAVQPEVSPSVSAS